MGNGHSLNLQLPRKLMPQTFICDLAELQYTPTIELALLKSN